MKNITGSYVAENYYMFDYFNEVVKDLGDIISIDFSKRFMTLGEIKKILASTKKWFISQQLYEQHKKLVALYITELQALIFKFCCKSQDIVPYLGKFDNSQSSFLGFFILLNYF